MRDNDCVYTDPFGRSWTTDELDEAMKMLRSLKVRLRQLDYY